MSWIPNQHSIYVSLKRLMVFYEYWKSHITSSDEAIFFITRLQKKAETKLHFIQGWKRRINYQSLHLLLSSSAAKDSTHSLHGFSHSLSCCNFISLNLCTHFTIKSLFFFLLMPKQGPTDLIHWAVIQAKTVLGFGLWSQRPSASCCAPRTEAHWSGGMMAEQCDAGPRINKPFNWAIFIKAAIDVRFFWPAALCVVS